MGRKVCTEPQCLYKGALYLLPLHNKAWLRPFLNTVMNRRVPQNMANFLLDDKTFRYNGLPVPQRSPFVSVPCYTPQTYLKG